MEERTRASYEATIRARRRPWVQPDPVPEPIYAIIPQFNQWRFKSRWKNYERTANHLADCGFSVVTVEAAFGEREHSLAGWAAPGTWTDCSDCDVINMAPCRHHAERRAQHLYVPLRTETELWIKESLIRIGVSRLPHDWKYVCWIDADIQFLRTNIASETIHLLQHYDFLQMFSHAVDLDPDSEMLGQSRHQESFMQAYGEGRRLPTGDYYYGAPGRVGVWTGLAWACRRRAWDAVGGIMDFMIHGGGDWTTAFALVGRAKDGMRADLHPSYQRRVLDWEALAERYIRRNVGMVTGTVAHRWHGKKRDRRYPERHKLLAELKYNPDRDIKYDAQGLIQLVDHGDLRSMQLRDVLRDHARLRFEDSIDVD